MRTMKLAAAAALALIVTACSSPEPEPTQYKPESVETAEGVDMPDVIGMPGRDAKDALERTGFDVETVWDDVEVIADNTLDAVATDPSAGDKVEEGAEVRLVLGVPPLPARSVTEDGDLIEVTVATGVTEREARWIVWELMQEYRADGAYFVNINCETGGAPQADNRLANGKFAIGTRGAALTGLAEGKQDTTLVEGASCP